MKRQKPLVSIVTPTYNYGRYLDYCIQSVLNQDYPYIEHIIQDSLSEDNTKNILKKYQIPKFKKRIKIFSEKDHSQADGLNKALKHSTGDILLVLNADDALMPYACSWGVEMLRKHPDSAVVYGDEYIINDKAEILSIYIGKHPFSYEKVFCVELVPPAQAAFIRTSMLEKIGFYADASLSTCPDYEMWVRLGVKYSFVHEFGVITKYRYHQTSEGRRPDMISKMVSSKLYVMNRVLNKHSTSLRIKRLRKRAYAGLYDWGGNMANSVGLYRQALVYFTKSFFYRPKVSKFFVISKFLLKHVPNYAKNQIRNFIKS